MNILNKKTVLLTLSILSVFTFINCDNETKQKEKEPAKLAFVDAPKQTVEKEVKTRKPIVFITGYDKGDDNYYKKARSYFQENQFDIVEGKYSIEEIINWLNENQSDSVYGDIHIVNKSNPFTGMTLETLVKDETVTAETLRKTITKGTLPTLQSVVNATTKIILHANGLGENQELMQTFKDAFSANQLPNVVASPYFSIFDGEFTKHYLAKPYYVFYPTAKSPGKVDLSKEIARKYPEEKDIDWYEALNNDVERYVGEPYTQQFTIPVKFELDYHNSDDEIPTFNLPEEVMDFIEQQEALYVKIESLNIPIEKFRWTWKVKNSVLTIKGKTTGLIVLKPLIKPYGELQHIQPDTDNKRLYAMN